MIDLNATFFVQFVNFILILILLNVILIGPIRRLLKERAELMASQLDGIDGFTGAADSKLKDYQAALDAARKAAASERLALKDEALGREKVILAEANDKMSKTMSAARADIETQSEAARKSLAAGVEPLAVKVVGRVLGGAA